MQWRDVRGDVPAFGFDLLITRLQQQRLTGSSDFANGSAGVRNALAALPMHLNQVRDKLAIITAARKLEYWAPNKPCRSIRPTAQRPSKPASRRAR
jgi:type I restriction enzyme R subunit